MLFLPGQGSCAAKRGTTPRDPVTTSLEIRDGINTRTVRLCPLRRERYLRCMLGELPRMNAECELPRMNAEVVRLLLKYPRNGEHAYWWPSSKECAYDGCTTDIALKGCGAVMRGEPKGRTFCCGITLEVLYRALGRQRRLPEALTGGTSGTAELFKKLWFCRGIGSPGPEEAMLAFGIGRKVRNPDDALPGDFVQIWRHNGSGHSVIFVDWAYDCRGRRAGMHYWSSNWGTEGIGFAAEPFGKGNRTIDLRHTSITRLLPPGKWKRIAPEKVKAPDTPALPLN